MHLNSYSRIDYRTNVMIHEPARISLFPCLLPQKQLQRCERTTALGKELNDQCPDQRRDVKKRNPSEAQDKGRTEYDEDDKRQVDKNHSVCKKTKQASLPEV